jgi:RNA polymerase sigma-70 factor, ECF subfamily
MNKDDHQLVLRCLDGDRSAFGTLYDRHATRVYHLLRRLLAGNAAEAEDLMQETFVAAYSTLGSWRGEGAFGTWLCGIAFRQYANHRRHLAPLELEVLDEEIELVASDSDPLAHYERLERAQQIEAAIVALPALCREVFILVKVEGMPYREAAQWLDIPLGTVQSRLWRAVRLLRTALAPNLTEFDAIREPAITRKGGKQDAMQDRV